MKAAKMRARLWMWHSRAKEDEGAVGWYRSQKQAMQSAQKKCSGVVPAPCGRCSPWEGARSCSSATSTVISRHLN